jgi:Flp pilus assembly protein TadG
MINKFKSNRGQTLVEFAIVLPLLLLLIFGIVEWGIIMYDKAMLTYGSREGARAAVVFSAAPDASGKLIYSPLTEQNIKDSVNNYLQTKLITFGTTFDANATSSSGVKAVNIIWRNASGAVVDRLDSREGTISVLVNFTYKFLVLPRLGSPGGLTLDLHAQTIMRME